MRRKGASTDHFIAIYAYTGREQARKIQYS